ncbi:sensor domain-containing protein [Labedella populi]|uniref:sensor domain-containing protein n=1 Tax=Labedella populi TaxID=2498850 RepID=UPI001FB6BD53|nr:sensor domain-containing protein [Labedella populi]
MTTDTAATTPVAAHPSERRTTDGPLATYGKLWRGDPRELGFLLPTLPIVIAGNILAVTLFAIGAGTIVIYVGLFVLFATLYVGRAFGSFELLRLRGAGLPPIDEPRWPVRPAEGFWRTFFRPFTDPHSWLHLVHTTIVNPIVGTFTWAVTIAWVFGGLGGALAWSFPWWIDAERTNQGLFQVLWPGVAPSIGAQAADMLLNVVVGLLLLATLPFVTHGLTLAHHAIARLMLARFRSEDLEDRVAEVQATRTAAAAAEGTALRRLERDIHDGPQQRLVRLQMDIAAPSGSSRPTLSAHAPCSPRLRVSPATLSTNCVPSRAASRRRSCSTAGSSPRSSRSRRGAPCPWRCAPTSPARSSSPTRCSGRPTSWRARPRRTSRSTPVRRGRR